jgi:dolichol-phosphate mannosyltransferase
MRLSVVSPVYGAASLLRDLVAEIEFSVKQITDDYEIILVEDHSPDNSQEIIRQIASTNRNVKGLFLSKNFGQQLAINAGLDVSTGDWIVTLDCDLQDTPAYIVDMYNKALEGYAIVYASRQNRQDNTLKKVGSKYFNRLLGYLTEMQQDESIANYVLYSREAVLAMKSMGDYRRYYPLMNHWVGFHCCKLPIPHAERTDGRKSSYTMRKRINLALNTAVAFSTKPLRLIVYVGFILVALSMLFGIGLIVHYLLSDITVSGWLTLFVSLWFIAGILIMLMGIIAVYIGEIFIQCKNRPSYIVASAVNI